MGGTEVANAARTVEYLSAGLANNAQGHWIIQQCDLCSVLYRLNGGDCMDPDVFVSPATDPAPWYDPTEPGSTSFLGVLIIGFTGYDSTATRVVTPRIQGLGGATFSGQRRKPREWRFRAALVSADDSGAEYGLRWLTSVLETTPCADCTTTDLTVRLVCPPGDCSDDSLGEWHSYEVVLTDGPKEVEQFSPRPADYADSLVGWRDCIIVEWVMAAGNPFLYKLGQECLSPEIVGVDAPCNDFCDFFFGPPGSAHVCDITTPMRGVIAPVYTFDTSSGMNEVLLGAFVTAPLGSDPGDPVFEMALTGIPRNSEVVVDCALRTITVLDFATGITQDGQYLIDLSDGRVLQWPQAAACDDITCFTARTAHPCSQGGDTTVQIDTKVREG